MNSFPNWLLVSDRKHGGLGIISISQAAHERKRKVLLELVNKKGAEGIAAQGLLVNALRSSGQGGPDLPAKHLWSSLNGEGAMDSLVHKLKEVGLRLRVGWRNEGPIEYAVASEEDIGCRKDLSCRGISLKSELEGTGVVRLRIGQCWKVRGRLLEILAYRGDNIEYMEWTHVGAQGQGGILCVSPINSYERYPTGMGGRITMDRELFVSGCSHLLELGKDWTDKVDGKEVLMCRLLKEKVARVAALTPPPHDLGDSWAKWAGGTIKHIYTDGSFTSKKTLGQFLLGTPSLKAGGAIVLSDGETWVHRLYVEMDVETTKSFDSELICILLSNEIAVATKEEVIIHSDCEAAIKIAKGGYSEGFSNSIGAWRLGDKVKVLKVSAHPERYRRHEMWSWDDKGIWTADRVASGMMEHEGRILASKWLKRISSRSVLAIEEEDGTPFIGSVRERASRINMERYWIERDEWRAKDDLLPKWEGANLSLAFDLLRRNGGLEDHSTMLRLASGKRWDYSRHNDITCKACNEDFRGLRHPLLQCGNLKPQRKRKEWKDECYEYVARSKPEKLRPKMLAILHACFNTEGGEFACMGNFTKAWVDTLGEDRAISDSEARLFKRLLRVVVFGARGVMREFARVREVATGDAKELRQLSMVQFTKELKPKVMLKKNCSPAEEGNSPPGKSWDGSGDRSSCKLRWVAPLSELNASAVPFSPSPCNRVPTRVENMREARLMRSVKRATMPAPWVPWDSMRKRGAMADGVATCLP